ncbi:MAG: ATP-grasp domain-containing protein [Candidatus Hydrogenedentes bacterium]|nr:ATP-grasp domain-containing protein [Candidatus Hydrogenedentota bacterium]
MTPGAPLTVLVLAVGGNVSQGILKALARARRACRVVGADIRADHAGLFWVDRARVSPWAHEPEFLPWLIDCCRHEGVQLILSGAEPVLMALAQHRGRIEAETGACCLVSDWEVMETCDDKWKTAQWLAARGSEGPESAITDDPGSVDALAARCGFPLVAKPRRGGGARGFFAVQDAADLDYIRRKPGYLIQAYAGSPEQEYTVACFADRDGVLAPSCCMRRDLVAGTTFRATLGDFPDIRAAAESIVAALKPLGPCNVQLRQTNRGPVCFEINPRFSGTAPIRAHYGYNDVEAAINHFLLGEPVRLPLITRGEALRYWNEVYVEPEALEALREAGSLESPGQHALIDTAPRERG